VPMIGSPPMPMAVDWPRPESGELADGFVGERAGARDDADATFLVDVAGHDADLAFAGTYYSRAIWPNEACALRQNHPVSRSGCHPSFVRKGGFVFEIVV